MSANTAYGPAGAALDNNPLGGILGEMLGESPQALKARVEEASKEANDLSNLVKHKKRPTPVADAPASNAESNGKRKADHSLEADETNDAKRQKTPAT